MPANSIKEHIALAGEMETLSGKMDAIAGVLSSALAAGNKALICGNGGSAADAQHFAAELAGRYMKERRALAALALNTDTSVLTAVANDYGFEEIFARQVDALGKKGDVLVIISTSGDSKNVLRAAAQAKSRGMLVAGLLGKDGGQARKMCDFELTVPSQSTPRIQEMHSLAIHMICEQVEAGVM